MDILPVLVVTVQYRRNFDMTSSHDKKREHQDPIRPSGDHPPATVQLTFDPDRVVRNIFVFCVVANVSFFLLDFFINYLRLADTGAIRRLFNTAKENGLAAWFSVTQTVMVALTLWLTFVTVKQQGGSKWKRIGWLVLALFFTYMAVDDGSALHERLGSAFDASNRDAAKESWGFPSYTWQILFLPLFSALGLFTLVFLWRELDERRAQILVAVALACFVLAVGLDFVEGLDPAHRWNLYTLLSDRLELDGLSTKGYRTPYQVLRHFSKSIEESLEMLGMTILWIVFLRHWIRSTGNLQVRFVRRVSSGSPSAP